MWYCEIIVISGHFMHRQNNNKKQIQRRSKDSTLIISQPEWPTKLCSSTINYIYKLDLVHQHKVIQMTPLSEVGACCFQLKSQTDSAETNTTQEYLPFRFNWPSRGERNKDDGEKKTEKNWDNQGHICERKKQKTQLFLSHFTFLHQTFGWSYLLL